MPSKGSYAKGVAKREEILQTALEVFSRQGYRKASLREISEAVGLTQAGLLHYFDSKEELFAEVLRKRDEADLGSFQETDAVESFVEVIRHNSEVPGLVHLYATLSAEGTEAAHPAHDYFVDRYQLSIGIMLERIRAGQADGSIAADLDAESVARMMIAIADGMQVQWLLDDEVDMGGIVESFWSLLQRVH